MYSRRLYKLFTGGKVSLPLIEMWQKQNPFKDAGGDVSVVKLLERRSFWNSCVCLGMFISLFGIVTSFVVGVMVGVVVSFLGFAIIVFAVYPDPGFERKYRDAFLRDLGGLVKVFAHRRIGCLDISALKAEASVLLVSKAGTVILRQSNAKDCRGRGDFDEADIQESLALGLKNNDFKSIHSLLRSFDLVDKEWTYYFAKGEESVSGQLPSK